MKVDKVYLFFRQDTIDEYGGRIISGKYSQNIYYAEHAISENGVVIKCRTGIEKDKISKSELYKLFTNFDGVIMMTYKTKINEN